MEVIELSGYITEEKIEIAKRHLVPKNWIIPDLKITSHPSNSPNRHWRKSLNPIHGKVESVNWKNRLIKCSGN
jgi:hypothetical protein